jgi:sugar phosphate isomerase/epimerase
MIRLGIRAHDFGRLPVEELAGKISSRGLCCAQLALNKAIAGLDLKAGELTPGLAWHIGQAFEKQRVQIAVLGCYINPIHPDPAKRRELLACFKDHLRFARDFGCGVVGLETGSLNADYSPHHENQGADAFKTMLVSIAELVEEAERFGVFVAIEGVTSHTVSTPARMRRVLDTIQSNHLQVIFDPVNFISLENHAEQEQIIKESFDLFGERIVVIHAKDFTIEGGAYKQVRAGLGRFNHDLLLSLINQRKPGISIVLEETSEANIEGCVSFLRARM